MKRRAFTLAMTMLLLAACGQEESTRGKMPEAEEKEPTPLASEGTLTPTEASTETPTEAQPTEAAEEDLWQPLTEQELAQIQACMVSAENGFFLSDYCTPEMIDWNEVCYCGAGIDLPLSDDLYQQIEDMEGEIYTDVTAIDIEDLIDFALAKTGTDYNLAQRPLNWPYLSDRGIYYSMHGDTNAQYIELTKGEANGDIYRLYYNRYDYLCDEDREYVMTAQISGDDQWMYLSNLPSETPTQASLLSMSFYNEEDKAQMDGYAPKDYVEIAPEYLYEDSPAYWVLLFALEDHTQIRLEAAAEGSDMSEMLQWDGIFAPGDELYTGTLNAGESVAVRVNLPWVPNVHLGVYNDSFTGEYWFGQDNWRHMESEKCPLPDIVVVGHDRDAEGRGSNPQSTIQFLRMFEGDWIYYDKGKQIAATFTYNYNPGTIRVCTEDTCYEFWINTEHFRAPDSAPADGISLMCFDTDILSQLPTDDYDPDELGDYYITMEQKGREQILHVKQVNNTEGILSSILPGADYKTTEFTFYRFF